MLDTSSSHATGRAAGTGGRRPIPQWLRVSLASLMLAGLTLLLYPATASWLFALRQDAIVDAQVEFASAIAPEEQARLLESARDYNGTLEHGLIVDPFGTRRSGVELDGPARRYLGELDHDPEGGMAAITIPSIGVKLPIQHGATEEVLRSSVGHIYGSSLPVGGAGSHAVLTAHSGIPEAELFSRIHELDRGDDIRIDVLGEQLTYRVTGEETILPTDVGRLGTVAGEDLLTLITCTPIGINTHRLLVHAERVETPEDATPELSESGIDFPWWAVGLAAGVLIWGVVAAGAIRDRRRSRAETLVQDQD